MYLFHFSFFDSFNDRYKLLKKNIQQFMIIQFGIATFRHVPYENTYKVDCFNSYLFPKSIPLKNRHLIWQVAALEFLCKHNFEFNKVCCLSKIVYYKTYLCLLVQIICLILIHIF